jgi:hypothetical protein
MNMTTLPQKQYKTLIRRQERVERELALLREVVKEQAEVDLIRPSALKKWERISKDLDHGKGLVFKSQREVKTWFKNL